jgi:hypothetical protein
MGWSAMTVKSSNFGFLAKLVEKIDLDFHARIPERVQNESAAIIGVSSWKSPASPLLEGGGDMFVSRCLGGR